MNFLVQNKEWIFSGIGVFLLSLIIGLALKLSKKSTEKTTGNIKQSITSGARAKNIQTTGNVTVHIGKSDEVKDID